MPPSSSSRFVTEPGPTLLAVDASSAWCSAALLHRGSLQSIVERLGHGHSRRLLPMVQELLAQHRLRAADCDAFAFGAGPGAFTGLRIACGVAQGLGYAAGRPVVPVDCIAATAEHARRLAADRYPDAPRYAVAVALDARMDQVYFGLHRPDGPQAHAEPEAVAVADPPQAARRLRQRAALQPGGAAGLLAAGDGFERYAAALGPVAACAQAVLPGAHAAAEAVARLAAGLLAGGGAFDAAAAAPRYVRDKVALDVDEQRALRRARAAS